MYLYVSFFFDDANANGLIVARSVPFPLPAIPAYVLCVHLSNVVKSGPYAFSEVVSCAIHG